jgi:serine/threonine-protein kinase
MNAPVNVGDILAGKYRVERVLGEGGMGIVVAATHMQLGELVAIKLLRPEGMTDKTVLMRFLREARAAARIRSEHVARVYDVGTLETGAPYLVMEYLEGSDLATIVRQRGPLPVFEAVEFILQVCEGIAKAHSLGIVHRDIKPANLFITARADGLPAVKVIDFGISKTSEPSEGGLAITATTEVRGSPLFMSPEQLLSTRNTDARTDIWSIGVSLFNLLTGSHPFPARTVPDLYSRVLHGDPVPLRAVRADAPVSLEDAIGRCLRRNVAERFANVGELASAISDHARTDARASVERISRILGETSESATAPRLSHTRAELGSSHPESTSVSPERGAPSVPPLLDSWATTQRYSTRRRRILMALALSIAGAGLGLTMSLSLFWRMRPIQPLETPTSVGASDARTVDLVLPSTTASAPIVQPESPASELRGNDLANPAASASTTSRSSNPKGAASQGRVAPHATPPRERPPVPLMPRTESQPAPREPAAVF